MNLSSEKESPTRALAQQVSSIRYEDISTTEHTFVEALVLDAIGNAIGAYPLQLSEKFRDLSLEAGGGQSHATLLLGGGKASLPWAAFANSALSTMLDASDWYSSRSSRQYSWPGPLVVPSALAAVEYRDGSIQELVTSIVAGYECVAFLLRAMDASREAALYAGPGETFSTFASAGAAGAALGLSEDEMVSALGMAGIYSPVPTGYKWVGDTGLTPRKDIKQGWSWFAMSGSFAALSAAKGLQMLQSNNVLDGEHGVPKFLGIDTFKLDELTKPIDGFAISSFITKKYPGCSTTHAAIHEIRRLMIEHEISSESIASVQVTTNQFEGRGFDEDLNPSSPSDMQFSIRYQVAAAIVGGEPGPNWYKPETQDSAELRRLLPIIELKHDDAFEKARVERGEYPSTVELTTTSGQIYKRSADDGPAISTPEEVAEKFVRIVGQALEDERQAEVVLQSIRNALRKPSAKVTELVKLLPTAHSTNTN